MSPVLVAILLLVLLFGFVIFFGPPYLPTRRRFAAVALDLLNLKPGETMLELGSGDGRVVLAAAKRGWNVVGIELNPVLVLIARLRTWRYRKQVKIIWGNYFRVDWPEAQGIFTFMIPRQMAELDHRIEDWHKKPVVLASFAFKIPGKKPVTARDGIFLYKYQ